MAAEGDAKNGASSLWTSKWTPIPQSEDGSGASDPELCGWVSTVEQAWSVKESFEIAKSLKFNADKSQKYTAGASHDPDAHTVLQHRIRFADVKEHVVPNDGVPFITASRSQMTCMFGRDKHAKRRKRAQEEREKCLKKKEDHPFKRHCRKLQASRKRGCPAAIIVKEVFRFVDYKVEAGCTTWQERKISKAIRTRLESGVLPKWEQRVYIRLPCDADHKESHSIGQHGHGLSCADALRRRAVSEDTIGKLKDLFESGHSPSSALDALKCDLREQHGEQYVYAADRSVCPDLQFCYRLYHKMFKKVYGEVSREETVFDLEKEFQNGGQSSRPTQDQDVQEQLQNMFDTLSRKLEDDPEVFRLPLQSFVSKFETIATDSALASALSSFAKHSTPAARQKIRTKKCLQTSTEIGLQPPTAVTKRKTPPGGRRALITGQPPKTARETEHGVC
ncbi:uncharacterized protein LOC119737634 [Patiria miniata]|uniref:Uncharacterized protein n=1 Tax=Patiria miniata TaxID=46514 RepID=A0A914AXN6_PATMI|nr:uncharacterized protein LOC119737634 [Patiria miniata]